MVACGVERLFGIDKVLPTNRGGVAEEFGELGSSHRGEVIPRDPGEARDRESGTGVTVGIISIDPTLSFYARAPVLDHFSMADGDRSA